MITPESMQQAELDELLALTERQDRELEDRRTAYLDLHATYDRLNDELIGLRKRHAIVCKALRRLLKEDAQ